MHTPKQVSVKSGSQPRRSEPGKHAAQVPRAANQPGHVVQPDLGLAALSIGNRDCCTQPSQQTQRPGNNSMQSAGQQARSKMQIVARKGSSKPLSAARAAPAVGLGQQCSLQDIVGTAFCSGQGHSGEAVTQPKGESSRSEGRQRRCLGTVQQHSSRAVASGQQLHVSNEPVQPMSVEGLGKGPECAGQDKASGCKPVKQALSASKGKAQLLKHKLGQPHAAAFAEHGTQRTASFQAEGKGCNQTC